VHLIIPATCSFRSDRNRSRLRNQNEPLNPVVLVVAVLTGLAVPLFGEFKGFISIIQACAAAVTVLCIWRYPVSAIPIYLFWYQFPFYLSVGHALIPYPGAVLSMGIVVSRLLPMRQRNEAARFAPHVFALLGCLFFLSAVSSFWGNGWIPLDAMLGFIFALGSSWILCREKDWWVALGLLGLAQTMVALVLFHYKKAEVQSDAFLHERGELTGDANYASFFIGLAVTMAWCVAMRGCSYLKSRQRLAVGLRVVAILTVAAGLYILIHFQSRGLSAAVVGALAVSILHLRNGLKHLLAAGLAAGLLLGLVSQTSSFGGFMQRWSDKSELSDGNARLQLWKWVFEQWQEGPLFNKLFGFGSAAEIEKAGALIKSVKLSEVSTHNIFVRFFLDQGVVGMGLLVSLLALCAHCAWRRKDDMGNIRFSLLAFITLAGLSIEPQREPVFWISLALCLPIETADLVHVRSGPRSAYRWWARGSSYKRIMKPILGCSQARKSRRSLASRRPFGPFRMAISLAPRRVHYLRLPRK